MLIHTLWKLRVKITSEGKKLPDGNGNRAAERETAARFPSVKKVVEESDLSSSVYLLSRTTATDTDTCCRDQQPGVGEEKLSR